MQASWEAINCESCLVGHRAETVVQFLPTPISHLHGDYRSAPKAPASSLDRDGVQRRSPPQDRLIGPGGAIHFDGKSLASNLWLRRLPSRTAGPSFLFS
jgi:hypothetical protein